MAHRLAGAPGGDDRAAVIDIGSNTIHLLVADCSAGPMRQICDRHVRAGLGIAVADGAPLGSERIREVASIVREFAAEARDRHALDVIVFGTHAVRAAPDRAFLIEAIEREAMVAVQVLSPEQEAILCVAGASLGPLPSPPFLCADIGGGSCDLAAVLVSGVCGVVSVSIGSGVLAAQDLGGDPPPASQVDQTAAMLDELFAATGFADQPGFSEMVVTGGAARQLRRQIPVEPSTAALPASALFETVQRLLPASSAGWPCTVSPERAALVRAGGMILRAIMVRWRVSRWRVSPYGAREGALVYRARGLSPEAAAPPAQHILRPRDMEDTSGHPHA